MAVLQISISIYLNREFVLKVCSKSISNPHTKKKIHIQKAAAATAKIMHNWRIYSYVKFFFCIRCGLLRTCRPTSSSLIGSASTCSGSVGKQIDVKKCDETQVSLKCSQGRSFFHFENTCYYILSFLFSIINWLFFFGLYSNGFKGLFLLFRQQNNSDLDRQHRMKSKPLKLVLIYTFEVS